MGVLTTPHGVVKTPSYVFVGTYGKFLHLSPNDIKKTKTQIIIANTFHLQKEALRGAPSSNDGAPRNLELDSFLTQKLRLKIPTMTDSGGFQVLSLAFGEKSKISKFMSDLPAKALAKEGSTKKDKTFRRSQIKITPRGVYFKFKGRKMFLGPELSMKIQHKIGADIMFAFDHITSPLDDFKYNKKAVEMTNKWALQCLKINSKFKQQLFGIVQGGLYKSLRQQSAKFIGSLPFDGFGIGGSYTKKQISKTLKWIIPYLPQEKPRHLLGVGKVADIFEAIENGVDLFDCVIPTREARHGRLYTKTGHMDIRKGKYSKDKKIIEQGCGCPTCLPAGRPARLITRSKTRELIKSQKPALNAAGQRLCLMHNMWFFNNLVERIRDSIAKSKFKEFKLKFLAGFDKS